MNLMTKVKKPIGLSAGFLSSLSSSSSNNIPSKKQLIEITSSDDEDVNTTLIVEPKNAAKKNSPKKGPTSAFLGPGYDFLRHPYRKKFLPLSRVVQEKDREKEQDFQYRIDPKNCVLCLTGKKLEMDISKNYNVMMHYAMETIVHHACPQRSHEKSKVGLVALLIISEEYPQGLFRYYTPILNDEHKKDDIRSFEELGHVLDHAATIFGDHRVYEVLRATPTYLNSLEELKLAFDPNKPWPYESDPTVPESLRQWYKDYCTQQSAILSNPPPPNNLQTNNTNTMSSSSTQSKTANTTSSMVHTHSSATDEVTGQPELIATLDPRKEPWIVAPPIVDHDLQYEGPPTKPDKRLTDWDYDPLIHNEETQTKLWADGKMNLFQKKRATGPSFLRKLKPPQ